MVKCLTSGDSMTPPPDPTELIKAELKSLERARKTCTDTGILKSIDARVEELKQKLELKE
jgi:hypothetical protein